MTLPITPSHAHEHPVDVLSFCLTCEKAGMAFALVVVVETEGGGVRSPGAIMAVSETGASAGYVSGGCIDADVVAQARDAIGLNTARSVRYGIGSPYIDLKLPCGGGINILILPRPDLTCLKAWHNALAIRSAFAVTYREDGIEAGTSEQSGASAVLSITYSPKLKIRAAGRGADFWTFSALVRTCGYDLARQTTDESVYRSLPSDEQASIELLQHPDKLSDCTDDSWAAFVLMFHDTDWESPLLEQALHGPAFYIGAVGARRAQANRKAALLERGVPEGMIDRIHAPIGLVHQARNASFLAISSLAEIIGEYQKAWP